MSITVSQPVSGFPSGSDRLVSTRINGVLVALPCFGWCTEVHGGQDHRFVEDFHHASEPAAVSVPRPSGAAEEVFSAQVVAYPHCGVDMKVSVDVGGDCLELDPGQADAFADDLIRTASRVRAMAAIVRAAHTA